MNIIKNSDNFELTKSSLIDLGLCVKEYTDLDLFLVKYDKSSSQMDNENVLTCRGLVGSISKNEIVCLPPIKSLELNNFVEQFNKNFTIEEFIDGTMINLFHYNGWHISTRSNIGANCRWYSKKHFSELFNESNNIDFDLLDTSIFYTFVLQHPENRIVTTYNEASITLVQAGKIENSEVITLDIFEIAKKYNFNVPNQFEFNNLNDLNIFIEKQNFEFQGVVLKNGLQRTKIRNHNYNYAKSLRGNTKNMKFLYFYLTQQHFLDEYLRFYPENKELFEDLNKDFQSLIDTVFMNYHNYHVKKIITNIKDMNYVSRPFCYELHGIYRETKRPINRTTVLNYMSKLPPARLVFAVNNINKID